VSDREGAKRPSGVSLLKRACELKEENDRTSAGECNDREKRRPKGGAERAQRVKKYQPPCTVCRDWRTQSMLCLALLVRTQDILPLCMACVRVVELGLKKESLLFD
jgi:hypothetical protein